MNNPLQDGSIQIFLINFIKGSYLNSLFSLTITKHGIILKSFSLTQNPNCQALVPSPVPLDLNPNPKQSEMQVQLGLNNP